MESVNFQNWASASKIDPLLLELLQEKSDFNLSGKDDEIVQSQAKPQNFPLIIASHVSVAVMVLIILLGIFHGNDTNDILTNAFFGILVFFAIGYCFGKILDWILAESSKSMIKEMLHRTETNADAGTLSDQNNSL